MSENEKNLKREQIVKTLGTKGSAAKFKDLKGNLDLTDRGIALIDKIKEAENRKPGGRINQDDIDRIKNLKKQSLPTTVEQALADGWTMGSAVGMSNPPVFSFTKDGKTISIRGKMSQALREHMKKVKPLAKKTGGVIKRRGGGIAKRGFGISK